MNIEDSTDLYNYTYNEPSYETKKELAVKNET